jgi:hypothetical protein
LNQPTATSCCLLLLIGKNSNPGISPLWVELFDLLVSNRFVVDYFHCWLDFIDLMLVGLFLEFLAH